jgi:hypothetical protein
MQDGTKFLCHDCVAVRVLRIAADNEMGNFQLLRLIKKRQGEQRQGTDMVEPIVEFTPQNDVSTCHSIVDV